MAGELEVALVEATIKEHKRFFGELKEKPVSSEWIRGVVEVFDQKTGLTTLSVKTVLKINNREVDSLQGNFTGYENEI